jgi:hypothetical protein
MYERKKFYKKMGPPVKDPSTVDPDYLKYKLRGYSYYRQNMEKIKQSLRDKRLAFNKTLPPLNLICKYCNKSFVLPGMNKNGHKQNVVSYCSSICNHRSKKLKKLWIPQWLFDFYFDKKLFRFFAALKGRGFRNIFKLRSSYLFGKNRNLLEILTLADIKSLYHPSNYFRKRWNKVDKWIRNYQKKKREKYVKNYYYQMSEEVRSRHKKRVRDWQKRQPKDSNFVIATKFRSTVAGALKRSKGVRKNTKTQILLGTDFKTARAHIENLFEPGMTWDNHGKWEFDHIIPCKSFDLKCPVQQLACCHYKNLQPLWAIDNAHKSAKLNYEFKRRY